MGIGLVGIALSWFQISGEGDWHDQMPWLVVGVVALAVSGLGTAGWLMAASRAVHLEAHDVMNQLRIQQVAGGGLDSSGVTVDPASAPASAPALALEVDFVCGPTMTKVHRRSCALVAGKPVAVVAEHEIAARGLLRCGVCCG
jgi:hypothetical protein